MIPEEIKKALEQVRGEKDSITGDVDCSISREMKQAQEAARAALDPENLEIGHKMPDGTKFAGFSPDTGKAMYVWPTDERDILTVQEAKKRAEELSSETGQAYRVPTTGELKHIFNHKNAIRGFDVSGVGNAAWYWSSTKHLSGFKAIRFDLGLQSYGSVDSPFSIRLVRD